jgi:hypothetical protein
VNEYDNSRHLASPTVSSRDLADLLELAAKRLAARAKTQAHIWEVRMFACKFDLPDYFGARVTAIHDHVKEAQSIESSRSRREALRKGLFESCSLLCDIDMAAVSYEFDALLRQSPSLSDLPPPPTELERFLRVERKLLTDIGVSGATIEEIDRLIRQVGPDAISRLSPDDVVVRFRRLKELVCARSEDASAEVPPIGIRSVWFGVAGITLVVLNAGAVAVSPPVSTVSIGFGGALLGRALGSA